MKGKRYSNEQIIYALKRVESGDKANEVCRQLGVSEGTFYLWKKKYGGMGVSELGRLKQLVADLSLDKHILQEVLAKKSEAGAAAGVGAVAGASLCRESNAGRAGWFYRDVQPSAISD